MHALWLNAMMGSGKTAVRSAAAEELAARVADDGTRPLLRDQPVRRRLDDLPARRPTPMQPPRTTESMRRAEVSRK